MALGTFGIFNSPGVDEILPAGPTEEMKIQLKTERGEDIVTIIKCCLHSTFSSTRSQDEQKSYNPIGLTRRSFSKLWES